MLFRKPKTAPSSIPLPLLPALTGYLPDGVVLVDALRKLTASPDYLQLARDLVNWPPNSLVSTLERAVLHWVISETRARAALEIGTAFAGTTLLLAASMLQVGRGKLYTIDPYGQERAPGILEGWPTSLQEIVEFSPTFSTDFFIPSRDIPPLDLVLVDGNHSYPNVMHDVLAAYEALRPGGFVVLDNAEQIDVLDAARDFGRLTRHAELARLALGELKASGDYRFIIDDALDPVETNSAFVVVRKPKEIHVTRRALAFHLHEFRGPAVTEVKAVIVNKMPRAGKLRGRINLRSIPYAAADAQACDLSERFGATIPPGRQTVDFPISELKLPANADAARVFVEANLFTGDEQDELILESLKINAFPVIPGRNFMRARG